MIKINNLNKYYNKNKSNEIHVINNINLDIDSPGLVTILGSSGAGKSTFLHVVGGLDKAHGNVIYENINLLKANKNKVDTYRNKHIGYIFQNYNLLPNLTVYENLKVQLELVNIKDKEIIDQKIDNALKIVGLDKYKRRKVTALSGGQQQRVSIARALVKGAKVIIADEPTGNLDTKNSIEILNILKILSKKYLILLVTHNISLAKHYSDRIITLKDGQIIDDKINNNNNSLLHTDSNAIYLKEYDKKICSNDENVINIYSKESTKLNFKIIVDNDTIYIENNTSLSIRVLDENTDRYIIDKEYDEDVIDESAILNLDYTVDLQRSFKKSFKYGLKSILLNFKNFFTANRKSKFIYSSFIFIGVILCLCLNALSISTSISKDYLYQTPKSAIKMDIANATADAKYGYKLSKNSVVELIEDSKSINGIVETVEDITLLYKVINNRNTTINIDKKCFVTTTRTYNRPDIKLSDNEVIISDEVANRILAYTKGFNVKTYEELKGQEFYLYLPNIVNGYVIVKDIIETSDYTFLLSDSMYFSKKLTTMTYSYLNYTWDKDGKYFSNAKPIEIPKSTDKKKEDIYQKSNNPEAIVNSNLVECFLGKDLFLSDDKRNIWKTMSDYFEMVGYVEEEGFDIVFRTESDYNRFIESTILKEFSYLPYDNYEIQLAENSRLPENDYEILLPNVEKIRNEYPIGSNYLYSIQYPKELTFKVVGYFEPNYPKNTSHVYVNYRTASIINTVNVFDRLNKNSTKEYYFYSNNIEESIKDIESKGYPTYDAEALILQETLFAKIDVSKLIIVMSVCILIVMIIFVFFINRSKMMQNIYDIGVMRALGAKKRSIYKDYFIESIIVTTFTIVLGFTLAFFFTYNADNFVQGISVELKYYFISLGLIYIMMIIASLMPIFILLRKTPIEIINKYDI